MSIINYLCGLFKKEDKGFYCGKGFHLRDYYKSDPPVVDIYIPQYLKDMHQFVFGSTGSGKSRFVLDQCRHTISLGRNLVIVDPKNDPDILPTLVEAARDNKRENDIIVLNAVDQEKCTHQFNPFAFYTNVEQIVTSIVKGINQGSEPFFYEQAYKVGIVAIKIDQYLSKRDGAQTKHYPISKLIEIFSYQWIKDRTETIERELEGSSDNEMLNILKAAISLKELSPRKFEEVSSSLSNVLSKLGVGNVFKLIDTNENVILERLWEGKGVICYLYTGALEDDETAAILSRVFLSMFQTFIGKVYRERNRLDRHLDIYIDEAAAAIYNGLETFIAMARGAGVSLTLLTQSLVSMFDRIGEELARVIVDNCAVKIFMAGSDPKYTGDFVSQMAGVINSIDLTMRAGADNASMMRDKQTPILDPSAVGKLAPRQFFILMRGNLNYKGTMKNIAAPKLKIKGY